MKKLLLSISLFCILWPLQNLLADDQWQDVERIVAVGDIHGDYEHYLEVLRDAGIINRRGNWIAGTTHFVQTGDLPDRGPDTDKIIVHMQKLEGQARRRGGMVHALIGNHEAMNIYGDLRYVHPGEYEAFRSRRSKRLRDDFYRRVVAQLQEFDPEFVADEAHRQQFDEEYPLGFVEHRYAWNAEGDFGSWVLKHNTLIKINRVLFLHGGISAAVLDMSISEINEQIRAELAGNIAEGPTLLQSETGPLWYRGLANHDEVVELAQLDAVLAHFDVDRIVVGHTPGLATIVPRFGARVLVIDTGISQYYGAHLASLIIEGEQLTNMQRGVALKIPVGDEDLLPYYQSVVELEPNSPALQQLVSALEAQR